MWAHRKIVKRLTKEVENLKQRNEILHKKKGRDKMLCELDKLIANHTNELKKYKESLSGFIKPEAEESLEKW